MGDVNANGIIAASSITDYFRDTVESALEHQHVEAAAETRSYIVNLLALFTRTDALMERAAESTGVRPLAELYGEYLNATSVPSRHDALRRLGDVALFISGLFAQSLARKPVDVDYYIAMGGSAYGTLSGCIAPTRRGRTLVTVFAELGRKFADFVDVLAEVGERSGLVNDMDLLRACDLWVRTGSRHAGLQLKRAGLCPGVVRGSLARH